MKKSLQYNIILKGFLFTQIPIKFDTNKIEKMNAKEHTVRSM